MYKFNIGILLLLGKKITILSDDATIKELPKLYQYLADSGFKPYQDSLKRSRHKNGYNYSLVFLNELLEHTGYEIEFFNNTFKYDYSDNAVAEEFGIGRNMFLYIKNNYITSYQIFCDAFTGRASRLQTKLMISQEYEERNTSQYFYHKLEKAMYKSGSSFLGYSSVSKRLNLCGLRGYKNYASLYRAFVSNSAKVRYVNDIVSCYDFNYTLNKKSKIKKSEHNQRKNKIYNHLSNEVVDIYKKSIFELKGLKVKSLKLSEEKQLEIIKEAVEYKKYSVE